ncbi:GNAT family N-acetyltransferase [Aestuariibacter halophilus]|uniref:GNAT family N-acetyltransferase n=1 Tax=Fluctibacter halophilus TaxID=226011 RepID=A0ABS8G5N5_9ALTE|nr:GNAT family N-acetyltransferase [Aestuariibacter halophilus]MCC2615914.1 GNAT family N-acetyltransferase [Aestuariibacter halophilus]
MKISLEEVTRSNYEAVCDLDVAPEQEQYVACNMWSLVESHYNQGHTCKAICLEGKPVGFFMWVQETAQKVSIWRFMVDKQYQNQGFGRVALKLAIEQIRKIPHLECIEICYNPANPVAKDFYSSFGFQEVGMDEDGDDMLACIWL